MSLFNLVLYAVIAFMIFKIFTLNKVQKKNRQLIDTIRNVDDEATFFAQCDNMINVINDSQYIAKTRVIKLWGIAYHKRWDEFEAVLDDITLEDMIRENRGKISIENDEDSFFYLYLVIPNMLYINDRIEERKMLREKMDTVHEKLDGQLCLAMSEANDSFFEKTEDKGQAFYEKLINGDYGEYWYSKSLIGLYKSMAGTQLAVLYKEKNETEKYEEMIPFVQDFHGSSLGKRWIAGLDVEFPELEEKDEEDTEEPVELEDNENDETKDSSDKEIEDEKAIDETESEEEK